MSCDRTEYRLLLHAHDALGSWERWQLERHLRTCPGCRQQFQRFGLERRALASCLVTPPMSRVSDRVALHLGISRPVEGPRLVMPRRLSAMLLLLVAMTSAAAAVAFAQWRQTGVTPLAFWQEQFAARPQTVVAPCTQPPCPAPEEGPGCSGGMALPQGPPDPLKTAPGAKKAATPPHPAPARPK